ncbi:MAG: hypothetical protein R3E97_01780 [Candidatus Eisenbacteria bacterium]
MRTPSLDTAADKILKYFSHFHLVLLGAAKVAQKSPEIPEKFGAAHDAFQGLITARDEAELALIAASAHQSRAHAKVQRGLKDFAYAILGSVEEDRSSPRFKSYFPDGYAYISRSNMEDLIASGEQKLTKLAQVPDDELTEAGQKLSQVIEEVKAVQAQYEEARKTYAAAVEAVENGKGPWREAYRASYYALAIYHADDPRLAEDYFRQAPSNRSQAVGEPDDLPMDEEETGTELAAVTNGSDGSVVSAATNGSNGANGSAGANGASGASGSVGANGSNGANGSAPSLSAETQVNDTQIVP